MKNKALPVVAVLILSGCIEESRAGSDALSKVHISAIHVYARDTTGDYSTWIFSGWAANEMRRRNDETVLTDVQFGQSVQEMWKAFPQVPKIEMIGYPKSWPSKAYIIEEYDSNGTRHFYYVMSKTDQNFPQFSQLESGKYQTFFQWYHVNNPILCRAE